MHHSANYLLHLYICTVLSLSIPLCSTNAHPANVATRVFNMPFSEDVSNPCTIADDRHQTRKSNLGISKRRTVLKVMKLMTSRLQEDAERILQASDLESCGSSKFQNLATFPSTENRPQLEVLRIFYTSLLKHVAYMFFSKEQIEKYSHDNICKTADRFNSIKLLANKMKSLTCYFRQYIVSEEDYSLDDFTNQILNEELYDEHRCSRRKFRDCQILRSTDNFLRELSDYLQKIR